MTLPLDHVVVAVADLDTATAACQAAGFTVAEGGRHPGRPTRNALVVFADGAYMELITYEAPAPQERWWHALSAHGDGLVDFALLPADIEAVVQAAHARGFTELQARPGERTRPDGVRIAWQSARQATADLPFLCADLTPRRLRVPEGAVRQHANGVTGIAEVQVAVRDVAATLQRYRAFLGPDCVEGEQVRLAGAVLSFVQQPERPRGEGPCALRLRGARSTIALPWLPLLA